VTAWIRSKGSSEVAERAFPLSAGHAVPRGCESFRACVRPIRLATGIPDPGSTSQAHIRAGTRLWPPGSGVRAPRRSLSTPSHPLLSTPNPRGTKEGHPPPPNLVASRADKKPTRTSTAEMGPKGSSGGPIFEYLAQSIASEVQSEDVRRTCSARTSRSIRVPPCTLSYLRSFRAHVLVGRCLCRDGSESSAPRLARGSCQAERRCASPAAPRGGAN